jgi:acid phosphatase family membrane protein YuiD
VAYALSPLLAYVVAGALKFLVNCIRLRKLATAQIGLGGFPSTHTAIVSSVLALVAVREGISDAAFGVALALTVVVVIDAVDLRRKVGRHASAINVLLRASARADEPLRERTGHSLVEVLGGFAVGALSALASHWLDA